MYESGMPKSNMENKLPSLHWQFPAAAKFGRIIPKEKLYSQVRANAELKQLFVSQIAQIKWAYKLAENTINLAKTSQVEEIEIIQIKLKTQSLDEKLLTAIDKAIPHPTIFILQRQKQGRGEEQEQEQEQGHAEISYKAAYKQKLIAGKDTSTSNAKKTIKATKEKWQHSHYLQSAWLATDTAALALPTATSLQGLYQLLLEALLPQLSEVQAEGDKLAGQVAGAVEQSATKPLREVNSGQAAYRVQQAPTLQQKIEALAAIEAIDKQLAQVKNKRDKEKQFNRRLALNNQCKTLAVQLGELKAALKNKRD